MIKFAGELAKDLIVEALGDSYYHGLGVKIDADRMHAVLTEALQTMHTRDRGRSKLFDEMLHVLRFIATHNFREGQDIMTPAQSAAAVARALITIRELAKTAIAKAEGRAA